MDLRADIQRLLGVGPGDIAMVAVEETECDEILQRLSFTTSRGDVVPGLFLPPTRAFAPGLIYCHAHGDRYDIGMAELAAGRPALIRPYLEDLRRAGLAVLCLEMPCFGARADPGESALSKARHWRGETVFGQMLAEQAAGVSWLARQPGVDPARIGAMGISMGGTLAWWLAALDPRVAAAASLCCFADLGHLVDSGAHDGHGAYMTVPGLLTRCSTGRLSGLTAPRPLLHCVGLRDWSTPPEAFTAARDDLERAYARASARDALAFHIEPDLGHAESPAMRARVLEFLTGHL